ncbi:MAG: transcriptional repressor [Treponema sp.]|uniref:transcriptional repressor n=1 Tax=Treponema sp. TaxID=166 RepID=UPI0025CE3232|nr:transcriptional repressor [Treponema sp.]MBQ9282832.1 transcriptional repressor [Treponema sp.]
MQVTEQFVISKLRDFGQRITKQKSIVIKNILANPNSTAKEIYYLSKESHPNINLSTVYRTVKTLESIGLLGNRNITFCSVC